MEEMKSPTCPGCGKSRPYHEKDCQFAKLAGLALEMWNHIWKMEGHPSSWNRCGGFESRLVEFLSYPGSSHFPSCSVSSDETDDSDRKTPWEKE